METKKSSVAAICENRMKEALNRLLSQMIDPEKELPPLSFKPSGTVYLGDNGEEMIETAKPWVACCHDWRCPGAQPPWEFMGNVALPRILSSGVGLGRGYITLDQIPRDKPCAKYREG